jgi:hypothetical protein
MARTKQPNDSTLATAPATAPTSTESLTTSEFIAHVGDVINNRRAYLKSECARLYDELLKGKELYTALEVHVQSLTALNKVTTVTNLDYQVMLNEARDRQQALRDFLMFERAKYNGLREEFYAIQQLQPAGKEAN